MSCTKLLPRPRPSTYGMDYVLPRPHKCHNYVHIDSGSDPGSGPNLISSPGTVTNRMAYMLVQTARSTGASTRDFPTPPRYTARSTEIACDFPWIMSASDSLYKGNAACKWCDAAKGNLNATAGYCRRLTPSTP